MSRTKILLTALLFGLLAHPEVSSAQEDSRAEVRVSSRKFELADPTGQTQVKTTPLTVKNKKSLPTPVGAPGSGSPYLLKGLHPENAETVDCKLKSDSKGSVVARKGNKSLVVFDKSDWAKGCGRKMGVNGMPMAWIDNSNLNSAKSLTPENHGDRCAAFEYLEKQKPENEVPVQGTAEPCVGEDCKVSPLAQAAREMVNVAAFHAGNRCLIETDANKHGPDCSFTAMLNSAQQCGTARCSKGECEKRLSRMAFNDSPWKDKGVDERFQLIMKYAKDYAPIYGIEARAIPCIATVETGYLEPQAKTLLACADPAKNRYHGLGMITQSTLEHYVSPFTKFSGRGLEKGRMVAKEFGSFKSTNPLLKNRPSLYACPKKLHDLLGSSPDLQVEMMAYTLAEKKAGANGNDYQAYVNYNAHGAIDPENGKKHMYNYADAVQSCVSCLKERMPDKVKPLKRGKDGKPIAKADPVECLSAATRGSTKHPYNLVPSDNIYKVFEGYKKRFGDEK